MRCHWTLLLTTALVPSWASPAMSQVMSTQTDPPQSSTSSPSSALRAAPAEAPSDEASAVGDIIVTAQKRSERLSSVPMSITAATGEQLAQAGVTDPSMLVKIVPGFTYQLSQYGTPVFGIRGISFFDTSGTAAPAVSVYVDQIPLPLSILSRGASLDVERVRALAGRRFRSCTTDSRHYLPIAPNLLAQRRQKRGRRCSDTSKAITTGTASTRPSGI
jgi:hypothetical protein